MGEAKFIPYHEGDVLLREGETNEDMFKIVKGHVELYTGYGTKKESLLGILGEQAIFGEFGLLLKRPSIYTAIAYSDGYLLRIKEGDMGDFVRENHKNIIEIMRNMASNMMTMRMQIDLLIQELEAGNKLDRKTLYNARKVAACCGKYRSIEEVMDQFGYK